MNDFYRLVRHTTTSRVKDVDPERAIRLYPEFTGGDNSDEWRFGLQVRGPSTRANGSDGPDFLVATARCSIDDLLALREAIDEQIKDAKLRHPDVKP